MYMYGSLFFSLLKVACKAKAIRAPWKQLLTSDSSDMSEVKKKREKVKKGDWLGKREMVKLGIWKIQWQAALRLAKGCQMEYQVVILDGKLNLIDRGLVYGDEKTAMTEAEKINKMLRKHCMRFGQAYVQEYR